MQLLCSSQPSQTHNLRLEDTNDKQKLSKCFNIQRDYITWEACTMIGTPRSLWPERPIAKGTEVVSTNSMYAIPLDLLEFLSEMILTSRTFKEEQ